jgi:imidazoleglycerol-phosphate dehydratase
LREVTETDMGERTAEVQRRTRETDIQLRLNVDGTGQYDVATGVGFLDHMLAHVAVHGLLDLAVQASGDLHVDEHHTVEDVALCLGQALHQALGDRSGIMRTGHALVPMDEALALTAIDLSGRPYAVIRADFDTSRIGTLGTSLIHHFLETLAIHGRFNLHARVFYGHDDHHKAEALFKALGQALRAAAAPDPRRGGVPSTKGTLTK